MSIPLDMLQIGIIKDILEEIRETQKQITQKQIEISERLIKQETCLKNLEKAFADHLTDMESKADKATNWKLATFGAVTGLIISLIMLVLT